MAGAQASQSRQVNFSRTCWITFHCPAAGVLSTTGISSSATACSASRAWNHPLTCEHGEFGLGDCLEIKVTVDYSYLVNSTFGAFRNRKSDRVARSRGPLFS